MPINKNVNINKNNVAEKERVLQLAYKDLITFGKLFAPADFLASKSPPFHYHVGKVLLDRKIPQTALIIPRDHCKSTLASTAILHKFLFATKEQPEFICWIGEAQDQAIDNLHWVQNHIYENPNIHYYFGDLTGNKWTKTDFTLKNGCRMIAKGTSQRIRGKKELHTRYTGIVLDDFESEINTKTAEARIAIKNWVTSAVYPAIDFDKGAFLWCNGTIVHWDSLLNNILEGYRNAEKSGTKYSWHVEEYKAIQPDGSSLWESRWSLKKLEERKRFYIDTGTPSKFYQEFMNQARSPEEAIFDEDDINRGFYEGKVKYDDDNDSWYIHFEDGRMEYINVYIGVDPASSINIRSDYSVVFEIGVTAEHDFYVLDYWRKRAFPMDCAEQIFKTYDKYKGKVKRYNIETIGYQEMLRDYIRREMKKRGVFLSGIEKGIKSYGAQKKKDRLFEGLQPLFKSGAVHLKKKHTEFIGELLDFPKGSHDDTIDGFWLATQFTRKTRAKKKIERIDDYLYQRSSKKAYNWIVGARI